MFFSVSPLAKSAGLWYNERHEPEVMKASVQQQTKGRQHDENKICVHPFFSDGIQKIHACGAPRGNCDHRNPRRHAPARAEQRESEGNIHYMSVEAETDRNCGCAVSE